MKQSVSGVRIRKVYKDDFENVYPLLLDFQTHHITKDQWHQLFINPWGSFVDYCGYMLADGDKAVGFLGTIFSKRYLNGQEYKFCNLSSWIVKPEYRAKSISLLRPILKLEDYTITNLTCAPLLYGLFKKLGFKDLGLYSFIFPPLPPINFIHNGRKCHVVVDQNIIYTKLNTADLIIFNDHVNYKCIHLIIESDMGNCYIVATRVIRWGLPFVYIHYVSNLSVFAEFIYKTIFQVLINYKSVGIIVDERLLRGRKFRLAIKSQVPGFKIYKSLSLQPEDINNLYTEFILLNL
ncbi:MAG: hypothetical protein ACYC6G_13465 [Desulfobaccales bacterium]